MSLVAHLRNKPFATEMVFVLAKSYWVFTPAHGVARKFDDSDKHNQADNDAENGSNSGESIVLLRRSTRVEVCILVAP